LIIVPPGEGVGRRRVTGLVELADLAPTILDYAGLPIPPEIAACTLRPLVEGADETRDAILSEHETNDRSRKGSCVRSRRYKYIYWTGGQAAEFYDLQEDPDEQVNLAADPGYAAQVRAHQEMLIERMLATEQHYGWDESLARRHESDLP
jgi:arylsulfatase A-like enzyme